MTPATEAGKRLVKWAREGQVPWDVTEETVLDIERQAVAHGLSTLRKRVVPMREPMAEANPWRLRFHRIEHDEGFVAGIDAVLALIDTERSR